MRLGVEDRGVTVGGGVRLGYRALREPLDLVQDAARSFLVHLAERFCAQQILPLQHLKEIELDVPEVALEVSHRGAS